MCLWVSWLLSNLKLDVKPNLIRDLNYDWIADLIRVEMKTWLRNLTLDLKLDLIP